MGEGGAHGMEMDVPFARPFARSLGPTPLALGGMVALAIAFYAAIAARESIVAPGSLNRHTSAQGPGNPQNPSESLRWQA